MVPPDTQRVHLVGVEGRTASLRAEAGLNFTASPAHKSSLQLSGRRRPGVIERLDVSSRSRDTRDDRRTTKADDAATARTVGPHDLPDRATVQLVESRARDIGIGGLSNEFIERSHVDVIPGVRVARECQECSSPRAGAWATVLRCATGGVDESSDESARQERRDVDPKRSLDRPATS